MREDLWQIWILGMIQGIYNNVNSSERPSLLFSINSKIRNYEKCFSDYVQSV